MIVYAPRTLAVKKPNQSGVYLTNLGYKMYDSQKQSFLLGEDNTTFIQLAGDVAKVTEMLKAMVVDVWFEPVVAMEEHLSYQH